MVDKSTFTDKSCEQIVAKQSVLCMGCDPQLGLMPRPLVDTFLNQYGNTPKAVSLAVAQFFMEEIDAVADIVPWVKPQSAFYEKLGSHGIAALEQIVAHARKRGLLVILDAKRGDGGDTARAYAQTYLGQVEMGFDADGRPLMVESPLRMDGLTIQPYIGSDCVMHFVGEIKKHGTLAFVVTKTSFKTADAPCSEVEMFATKEDIPVWQAVAHLVAKWGDGTEGQRGWRNLGVVMGATFPQDTPEMRRILPKSWFLIPGFGNQGGSADDAVVGIDQDGFGGAVNSARNLNYAFNRKGGQFQGPPEKFAELCRQAALYDREQLNLALRKAGKGRAFLGGD